MFQQRLDVVTVFRKDADADAHTDGDFPILQSDRIGQDGRESTGDVCGILGITNLRQDHDEFVAAMAEIISRTFVGAAPSPPESWNNPSPSRMHLSRRSETVRSS